MKNTLAYLFVKTRDIGISQCVFPVGFSNRKETVLH